MCLRLMMSTSVLLTSAQDNWDSAGVQLLLAVRLSIITSYHQTVAAAPLQPTTPLSHVWIYQPGRNDKRICTLAVQTVLDSCASIAGNISNPIRVNTVILYRTRNLSTENTNIEYIISIGSLATALIIGVVVSITVIVVTLTKSKAKIKAVLDLQLTNRMERSTHTWSQCMKMPLVHYLQSVLSTHKKMLPMATQKHQ